MKSVTMSSRRKKAPPLRVDDEAKKKLNWNMLEDRKCEEEENNNNPPTCSSPPPITPSLPPPPEISCPPPPSPSPSPSSPLDCFNREFILSPAPDCGRKTLLLMINREGQLSIRYTAGGRREGGRRCRRRDLDWMQKRSLVQLMHRQEEGGVKVGVYLLEAGLVKPDFLSGGNARMKKANQLMQKLMEYFYDFIIPEVVEGEELEQNVEEMYEHVRLQHQSEDVGGEVYDVQHQALIPVLRPYQSQASLHFLWRDFISLCGKKLFYNPFTGWGAVTRGGILADEMVWGRRWRFLALILMHSRGLQLEESTLPQVRGNTSPACCSLFIMAVRVMLLAGIKEMKTGRGVSINAVSLTSERHTAATS
ncbi:hypothetical protein F7725_008768 [Dissostichus mawsoni]|uniref:Uncharacterized protein n=1 Tax=Dissostichus mawsoni TaxID=36200 RepID=A0A7J5Y841_DISMA|nr:hypothetical protein F7725_008768 [Dissostichus mawsoni]